MGHSKCFLMPTYWNRMGTLSTYLCKLPFKWMTCEFWEAVRDAVASMVLKNKDCIVLEVEDNGWGLSMLYQRILWEGIM